jgi:hypothetical protein
MNNSRQDWTYISPDFEDIEDPATIVDPAHDSKSQDRRGHPRSVTSQHISISFGTTTLIADLVELSQFGTRLRIVNGAVPNLGSGLSITLFDGSKIAGTVMWLDASFIGVSFKTPVADLDDRLLFEDLGQAYFSRALVLQKATQSKR